MTKRYYIAGPITGEDSVDVRLSFYRMERRLLDSGFKVYNPAALPEGLDWGTYMQMALAVLCSDLFDGIIMLRGWSRSNGAQIERLAAQAIGIPIFYEDDTARAELTALPSAEAVEVKAEQLPPKVPTEWINDGMVLVPQHDWIEMQKELEGYASAEAVQGDPR